MHPNTFDSGRRRIQNLWTQRRPDYDNREHTEAAPRRLNQIPETDLMRWTLLMASVLLLTLSLSAFADDPKATGAANDFAAIKGEWDRAEQEFIGAWENAKTAEERKLVSQKAPKRTVFADRFLKFADAHLGSKEELFALCWAGLNDPDSDAGKKATARLTGGRIDRAADLNELFEAFEQAKTLSGHDVRPLVPVTLARAKRSLDHPRAARLLAWVCAAFENDDNEQVPEPFVEAADLIADRFADSPNISHFCEALSMHGCQPWAGKFEKQLRVIIEKNRTPLVQATSRYALAMVVRSGGVDSQGKSEELFRQFIADYDGKTKSGVEAELLDRAKRELKEIQRCGLGRPAQEIEGEDLDGKPLKLSEHKGKVVLLVFWASWCAPCMRDIPHEKALVERFAGRPFVLIGVNGDGNKDNAKQAVERAAIAFRSFWNGTEGAGGPIADAWAVGGWPTVYVIDHAGVIRHNRLRGKRLDGPLESLVVEAETAAKSGGK